MEKISIGELLKMESRHSKSEFYPNDDFIMSILQLPEDRRIDAFDGGCVSNEYLDKFNIEIKSFFDYDYSGNEYDSNWFIDNFGWYINDICYAILGIYHNDELAMIVPQFEDGNRSNTSGKSVPQIYVFNEKSYYYIRNIFCEIIDTWGKCSPDSIFVNSVFTSKNLTDTLTGSVSERDIIESRGDIVYNDTVFFDDVIRVEKQPNDKYRMYLYSLYDIEGDDHDNFNGFNIQELLSVCEPKQDLKNYLPLDVMYSISMMYNKLYNIDISYGTDIHKKYYKHGMKLDTTYSVKQFVWIKDAEDTERVENNSIEVEGYDDVYLYCVFKDDKPVCISWSDSDALCPWVLDTDEFMSLWTIMMYELRLYKLLPKKFIYDLEDADNIFIDLSSLDEKYYFIKDNTFMMRPVENPNK